MPSNSLQLLNVEGGDPGRFAALATFPGAPEWWVSAEVVNQNGSWVVESLTVRPPDGAPPAPGGVTQTVLRQIAPSLIAPAIAGVRIATGAPPIVDVVEGDGTARDMRRQRQPRGPSSATTHPAVWAARYVEALGTSRQPVDALAGQYGFSTTHVRDMVRRARLEGYLTPTTRGRAGGELTDKARAHLEEER